MKFGNRKLLAVAIGSLITSSAIYVTFLKWQYQKNAVDSSRADEPGTVKAAVPESQPEAKQSVRNADVVIPPDLSEQIARLSSNEKLGNQILAKALVIAWVDPIAGIDYLRHELPRLEQNKYIEALLVEICSRRFTDFEKLASYLDNPISKSRIIGLSMEHWANSDPIYLGKYSMEALDGATKRIGLAKAIRSLSNTARTDEALRFLRELPLSRERTSALSTIAVEWTKKDVSAALNWAGTLENEGEKKAAISRVVGNASTNLDPEKIVAFANEASDEFSRRLWVSAATSAIMKQDIERAKQWAEELPAGYRDNAKAKVAGRLAVDSPEGAAEYAAGIGDPNSRAQSVDMMLLSIGPDLEKIRNWFDALPSDLQERAASGAVVRLFQRNSRFGVQWADSLPQGAAKDRANFNLVSLFNNSDTARVTAASQIVDPVLRNYAKKTIADAKRAVGTKP